MIVTLHVVTIFFGSMSKHCCFLLAILERAGAEVVECACVIGLPKFKVCCLTNYLGDF